MTATISIITICFNNPDELLSTIRSVDSQDKKPFEHWIIDGSTTNEIREYLENNPQPAYRKWITEKDEGIADAFNKGIIRSTGSHINILNSGDSYYDNSILSWVESFFNSNNDINWLHGKYEMERAGKTIIIGKPFDIKQAYKGMRRVCHQSIFLKRSLHDKYGLYDKTFRLAMDYEFVLRIRQEPFFFTEKVMIKFAPGGASTISYFKALHEVERAYKKQVGKSNLQQLWFLRQKVLFTVQNTAIGRFLFSIKTKMKMENV